jgi:hypothetical protein
VLLFFNSRLTLFGIPIPIPIIIVAACEFEEDKIDSMEVQQALPPVPEVSEPLPLAQEPVLPLFEIQASKVNQEDIWREQQEQPGGAKLTRPLIRKESADNELRAQRCHRSAFNARLASFE